MTDEQTPTPTTDDVQKAQAVGQAGAEAAAAAEPPEQAAAAKAAMRGKADEVGLPLSDGDIDRLANMFIDKLDARGAFEPPPEPVTAPATAPEPPAGDPAAAATAPPSEVEAPRRRTLAEKFLGA